MTLCEIDQVDFIVVETFFEIHTVDVRRKSQWLVVCRNGQEVTLKLVRTIMAGGSKLTLVSIDQMTNEQMIAMGWVQRTHG